MECVRKIIKGHLTSIFCSEAKRIFIPFESRASVGQQQIPRNSQPYPKDCPLTPQIPISKISNHPSQKQIMPGDSGKTVFVTGGAGYIGSHTIVELLNAGHTVIAIDNFTNSVSTSDGTAPALKRVEKITKKSVIFYKCDLLDAARLKKIFQQHKIDIVIHFAAMKAVGESMQIPLVYYKNNMIGTINLLEAMEANECYQLVFSSSCCVYGEPESLPITEDHPTGNVTNVYGRTKYFIEEMLKDLSESNKKWNIISLRYFNPVGAHPSGLIGEDPTKEFTNLMPYVGQVARGKAPFVTIFGNDYDTIDGTGVRDYIHVMDLASGHLAALKKLYDEHLRYRAYNLGTGSGISVLQLINIFQELTGCQIPYKFEPRREGDIVSMFANAQLASDELDWKATQGIKSMCEDFWNWISKNPNGYKDDEVNEKNGACSKIPNIEGLETKVVQESS